MQPSLNAQRCCGGQNSALSYFQTPPLKLPEEGAENTASTAEFVRVHIPVFICTESSSFFFEQPPLVRFFYLLMSQINVGAQYRYAILEASFLSALNCVNTVLPNFWSP